MSSDALWSARLVLSSGTPATLLSTETQRAICEAYVMDQELLAAQEAYIRALEENLVEVCREEVLKEREAIAAMAVDAGPDWAWFAAVIRNRGTP